VSEDLNDIMAADAEERASAADTTSLEELGRSALRLEFEMAQLEDALKAKKKALDTLMEQLIPQALSVAGISEFGFTTEDGGRARIESGTQVFASWSGVVDKERAVAYLEANGFAGGVVTEVKLAFTEDERELAESVSEDIAAAAGRAPAIVRTVNPSTLRAFISQRLKEDPAFDYALVGGTVVKRSKFTKRA
jgi:hypothetical protein